MLPAHHRCGNSYTRKLIEQVTGVVTGTHQPNLISSNFSLAAQGLKGEVHYDDSVWVVKTHYPLPHSGMYPGLNKGVVAICLVRNPLDVIASHF